MANGVFVVGAGHVRLERSRSEHGLGRETPGEHCLTDAFARHRVGGPSGVTDEQGAIGRERRPIDPGWDRPRGVPILELDVGSQRLDDVRSTEQIGPQLLHVLHLQTATALDAEPDVRSSVGQREAPHVPGQQVGFEPDVEPLACRAGDVAGVLAEGVPLAEVARLGQAEQLPRRRPHAVGRDHVATADRQFDAVTRVRRRHAEHAVDMVALLVDVGDGPPLVEFGAVAHGHRHERRIEFATWGGRREHPIGSAGERHPHLAAGRRSQPGGVDGLPVGHARGVEPERVEFPQCERREAVAAALVAWERGLVCEQDAAPGPGEQRRRRRAGRPGAHDHDVGDQIWSGCDAGGVVHVRHR